VTMIQRVLSGGKCHGWHRMTERCRGGGKSDISLRVGVTEESITV
jgi:hypothetical protein